ncbi:MAG TPA: LanC-like protein [Ramlibacter sp.]|nr:LanC-like protein [Ramlibacter sp.]
MLFSSDRHEPVLRTAWDERRARAAIEWIVRESEEHFSTKGLWPTHPLDSKAPAPQYALYWGACGVIWALRYLETQGAVALSNDYEASMALLIEPNRVAMGHPDATPFGSYLMGDTGIQLLKFWCSPSEEIASQLASLIRYNMNHPTRELMWGSPGTLLAALFMHERTNKPQWAQLFRDTARILWSQLEWSAADACHYWTQDMYGQRSSYLDAVHGFVATASPLIQGRHLLEAGEWDSWSRCIENTVRRTAEWEDRLVNWRARLSTARGSPKLMQYCHGAPGFVICLADFPDRSVDDLLIAGAEATWVAGPLRKGSNLCHGTGGNGYAFLKLYKRTGEAKWLERARAFAMHGIAQTEAAQATYGQLRYSLWTGDPGFAIYLWDCVRAADRFPTMDIFFA